MILVFNKTVKNRKYTRAKKLTPRMLNELVNHIEVHQAEKINGEWVQELTIYYNCVGALVYPGYPVYTRARCNRQHPQRCLCQLRAGTKWTTKMTSVLKGSNPIRTLVMVRQKGLEPPTY